MLIPRFWHKAEVKVATPHGDQVPMTAWGGSTTSLEEARLEAERKVQRLAQCVLRGDNFPDRYAYATRPMREEIVQEVSASPDNAVVITRNAYGALVLNCERTFFIDVDLEEPKPTSSVARLVGSLFGRKPAEPEPPETAALVRLKEWLASHDDWGVRIYRTRSGLRYLVTHATFEPGGVESEEAMRFLGADVQYVRLCRAQQCFRARLTPKPWRCGLAQPPMRSPWDNPARLDDMKRWLASYVAASDKFATCKLLGTMGVAQCLPGLEAVIALHDVRTAVESSLPLA